MVSCRQRNIYLAEPADYHPLPCTPVTDDHIHLFLSFGHVQMMTEVIKPLGISVLRTFLPLGKSSPLAESDLLVETGGRLYTDAITRYLNIHS